MNEENWMDRCTLGIAQDIRERRRIELTRSCIQHLAQTSLIDRPFILSQAMMLKVSGCLFVGGHDHGHCTADDGFDGRKDRWNFLTV